MMKQLFIFLCLQTLCLGAAEFSLTGKTLDPGGALAYKCGQTINFSVKTVPEKGAEKFFIRWVCRTDDGDKKEGRGSASQGVKIAASLKNPGFIYVYAELLDESGKPVRDKRNRPVTYRGGAGAEISKIRPFPEPENFDRFWEVQKARLKDVPVRAEVKFLRNIPGGKVYIVHIDSVPTGHSSIASGFLTVPDGAKPGSLKIEVSFNGYAYHRFGPCTLKKDRISFRANAHGFKVDCDDETFRKYGEKIKYKGRSYGFHPEENAKPETSYFLGMVLRNLRILEYMRSRKEWNGRDLIVSGESQGGFQSLHMAGLDKKVTQCIIGIPWCGDVGGRVGKRVLSDFAPVPAPGLNYFSTAHHAKRIGPECRVVITRAGLGDNLCPSAQVAAVFNNLPAGSEINWCQGATHTFIPPDPQYIRIKK